LAKKYGVGWQGRSFQPGKFEMSDMTNKILTSANAALYGILLSSIYALGYSPHIGFIHSGSPCLLCMTWLICTKKDCV